MHELTGNCAAVLRVLQGIIDQITRNQPASQEATAKALTPRSEAQRGAERDELVERLQRAHDLAQAAPQATTAKAVLIAVLQAHEKLLEQVRKRLEAIRTEKHLPDGNSPNEGQ
jgi:hypothetical protein